MSEHMDHTQETHNAPSAQTKAVGLGAEKSKTPEGGGGYGAPELGAKGEFTRGVWVVAYREVLRLWRDRPRMFSSLFLPLLLFVILGAGFGKVIGAMSPNVNFIQFLFPGIVAQTVFMTSLFSGLSVVWDREFGFMKELLVAPISRSGIVVGKVVGGAALALAQGFIILGVAPVVGIAITLPMLANLAVLLVIVSMAMSTLGILIASRMRSQQGFQVVMQLLILPLMFLSGVFFPLNNVPEWLQVASLLNPLTYGVDAIRHAFLDPQALLMGIDSMQVGDSSSMLMAKLMQSSDSANLGVVIQGHTMTMWQDAAVMAFSGVITGALAVWAFTQQD